MPDLTVRIHRRMMPPTPSALVDVARLMDRVWAALETCGAVKPSLASELELWQREGLAVVEERSA